MATHAESLPDSDRLFADWKDREVRLWVQSVRRTVLAVVTISCVLRTLEHCLAVLQGAQVSPAFLAAAVVCFAVSLFFWFQSFQASRTARVAYTLYLSLTQCYFALTAALLYPDCCALIGFAATIIFCMFELHSVHQRIVIVLLLARHFAMWHFAFAYIGQSCGQTLGVFTLALILVFFVSGEKGEVAQQHFEYYYGIKKQEEKMRAVLAAIREGLVVVTADRALPCFNLRMSELAGSADGIRTYLSALHCLQSIESDHLLPTSVLAQSAEFIENRSVDFVTFGVSKSDAQYYEWKGTKCTWEGAPACIITAIEATTWANSQLNLQQESASKTAILRYVSHELRTPANAILNLVMYVKDADNITEKQRTELSIVVASTHYLLSVVNDLLDFTRIVADKFALVKQSFDLRREVEEVVSLVQLQCAQKNITLRTNLDGLIPQLVYSDPTRIKQVLLNLLGNAVKFTFRGGLRVICVLTDLDTVRISVKDTGIGIPEDKIAGLCQVFGTVEGTQRINPQGCGLGLYISNLLAIALGGKPIDIQSKPGVGSEFSFLVHIFQRPTDEPHSESTVSTFEDEREMEASVSSSCLIGGRGNHSARPPDILIVDDSAFNRLVLLKMLESFNLRADEAATGLRAISKIRANVNRGHCYRLILMDAEMPEIDGITATQEIRSMEVTGELALRPVIVCCSAHRSQEDVDRCLAAGMDDYLEKPISRSKLQEIISVL